VILFEDLHWLDAETQTFLDSLVESMPTSRLFLLVNYRPEYSPRWGSKSYYRQVRIDPLAPASAEELLTTLLGADPALEPIKRRLVEWTEGNPFFLEETVRTLRDVGVLVGEPGSARLTRGIETVEVAPTVQAVLAARIDRLPEAEKRLLQSAAVVGTEVPFSLLQEIADQPNEDLRRGLSQLGAAEFLYESQLFPDLEFRFRHAFTHEVAYASLLHDRRRALHARIVDATERLHAERLAEHFERLAHHAMRGEVWDKAVTYSRQAGTKAQGRSAHREAVSWFDQALGALRHLPDSPETDEQAIDLRLSVRGSFYPLGEFEKILAHLQEAEALAMKLEDRLRLGWVSLHMGDYFRQTGSFHDASRYNEQAYAIAEELGNVPLKLAACQYLGLTRHALGDSTRAAELLREVVDTQQDGTVTGEWRTQAGTRAGFLAVNLAWLARSLADTGHFDEAIGYGRQGLDLAESLGIPYAVAAATFALGSVHGMRGELGTAIPLLERSRAVAHDWNNTLYECHALRALGYAYLRAGRHDEGLSLLRESAATVESRSLAVQHARVMALLGEACLVAGRRDEATAAATRALSLAQARGQLGDEATALAVLGQIALAADPPDRESAERHYTAAIARGIELGMRPLQARCHLGLGQVYLETGQETKAEEHLTAGAALCCEMDLPLLLGQALIALGRLGSTLLVARERRGLYDYLSQAAAPAQGLHFVLDRRVQDVSPSDDDRRTRTSTESAARSRGVWVARAGKTAPGSPGS
jgi:tetratricopeptide (TPR) repeat protein